MRVKFLFVGMIVLVTVCMASLYNITKNFERLSDHVGSVNKDLKETKEAFTTLQKQSELRFEKLDDHVESVH